jgi:hypothetical protein
MIFVLVYYYYYFYLGIFLEFRVVEINPFLSDPALHLFLQTELSISQMESYLKHNVLLSNIRDRVIAEQKVRDQKEKHGGDLNRLHDSQYEEQTLKSLTRSYSLDTILSLTKNEKVREKSGGRGWSNFIGDGVCRNEVLVDSDVTDFQSKMPVYFVTVFLMKNCIIVFVFREFYSIKVCIFKYRYKNGMQFKSNLLGI